MSTVPKRKLFTSFASLNLTQFFTALNDNLYKLLLIFFLINLQGVENSNTILSLAGAVFVIPFLLFASLAGTLADRFSKRSIIYFTRIVEIITTCLGLLAFVLNSALIGYIVLFLMATHSALFSPSKYGIIPELVPESKISHCNGIITATTYLAIILGTFLASFLTEVTHKNFVIASSVCIGVALAGALSSLGIEKTKPQAAQKKVSARFITEIIRTLKKARERRYLLTTIIFGAYFLFIGAYTQLNIIPYTLQSLHLSEVHGGYLFLMTAIGIGIGSFLAGKASGKDVEIGFVPLSAFGITLCFVGLFLFASHFYVVVILLMLVGLCGGFYIVPIDAFIQVASPAGDRGQNVAAANFMSFIGVIIASGLLAFLGNGLKLEAAEGFLVVGGITLLIALTLLLLFADQILRLFVALAAKLFCHIKVIGRKNIDPHAAVLLVAPRTSWLDTIVVMATLPRLIRYIVPLAAHKKRRSLLYRFIRLIPIDFAQYSDSTLTGAAVEVIKKELSLGHSICLMQPVDTTSPSLKEWEEKLDALLHDLHVPVVPIHIVRRPPKKRGRWNAIKSLTRHPIKIAYGKSLI